MTASKRVKFIFFTASIFKEHQLPAIDNRISISLTFVHYQITGIDFPKTFKKGDKTMTSKQNNLTSIIKNHARQLICLATAAVFAVGIFILSGDTVKSQRATNFKPSPFKFDRMPAPKKENPNKISALTSAGSLDGTFSVNGKLTTDFGSSEVGNAVAVQADGKIVAAGSAFDSDSLYDFAVFRYNADGSLDTSFDADGKVTTPISDNYNDYAHTVAIQTDGKIVAAGSSGTDNFPSFALVRYNADGSLDNSFGAGGKVITVLGSAVIYEIAIQADGKIIAAGYRDNNQTIYDFTLARYNPNGSLDVSFGTGGIVTTDFGGYDIATSVAVQTDGKIVAGGYYCSDELCFSSFAIARYNADGSLDASFDTDGKVITNFNGYGSAYSVAIQTDGKIVAVGESASCYIFNCAAPDFTVVRYNINGSLDTSFDGDGKVTTDFGGSDSAYSVVLQTNGKIVAAGNKDTVFSRDDFALVRLNADGSPDVSFDGDGKVLTDFGSYDIASDVAIQADGKIIAAGYTADDNWNNDFALSRYNADGSLDGTFDADGKVTTSVFVVSSTATAIALQENGRIVIAGYSGNGANADFAVAFYDNSYLAFKTTTSIGNFEDAANAVAIQADGKIIAAGSAQNGANYDFALVRYNPDGSLDTTFDGDGKLTTDFGNLDVANAVAIQPDGKIIAAGVGSIPIGEDLYTSQMELVRYNADGSLDTSFGAGGKVITQSVRGASAMVIQSDGKIIAAGFVDLYVFPPGYSVADFAIVRYNADGSLDTSFDGDGIARTNFGDYDVAKSVVLQADGKIVAAGYTRTGIVNSPDFALARYNPNGSLDTSFDTDGKVTTSFGASNGANVVGIQRNGKIVAAGFGNSDGSANRDFALVRYNPNGSLDDSFDTDGKVTTDFFGVSDFANAVAIQRDGKIVAAGSAQNGTRTDFAAARYIGDPVRTKFDYDGDGKSDVSVFRPTQFNGSWYVFYSSTNRAEQLVPNYPADKIVPADYDGDGRTDIAQFNSTTGTWYLPRPQGGSIAVRFGSAGDIPVPADYDGDGKDDVAVYRPSTGTWWIIRSSDGSFSIQRFGLSEDKPVAGDYDGDGRADLAVYRPSNGVWYLLQTTAGFGAVQFGLAEDKPVASDYDGDGKNDLAVFRPSTNVWYVLRSTNSSFFAVQFGLAADIPAPGDYDGDGKTDIAVYRSGVWYILQSSNSVVNYRQFGLNGDTPTQAAFIPQ